MPLNFCLIPSATRKKAWAYQDTAAIVVPWALHKDESRLNTSNNYKYNTLTFWKNRWQLLFEFSKILRCMKFSWFNTDSAVTKVPMKMIARKTISFLIVFKRRLLKWFSEKKKRVKCDVSNACITFSLVIVNS